MNTEVEMLTPYTKLAPLMMFSEDEEDTEEILMSWNRTESMRDIRSKETIESDVNDSDVFMNKSTGVSEILPKEKMKDDIEVNKDATLNEKFEVNLEVPIKRGIVKFLRSMCSMLKNSIVMWSFTF